jgi:hypothetical protein
MDRMCSFAGHVRLEQVKAGLSSGVATVPAMDGGAILAEDRPMPRQYGEQAVNDRAGSA